MVNHVIKKLNNGFVMAFVPHRGVKSVTIQLRGFAGSNFEKSNELGVAHLTEHMSLESPAKDDLLLRGAKIIGVTSRDDVLFMVKVLKKDFYAAVDYLYEVFTYRGFSNRLLESQKGVAEEEAKRFTNVPEKLIGRLSYRLMYPHQRISEFNTGSIEDIKKISIDDILEFKNRLYTPENFGLTVSGDLRPHQVISRSLMKFGGLGYSGKKRTRIKIIKLNKNKGFKIQNVYNKFFNQSHIRIDYYGYLLSNPERFAGLVLAKLLDNYLKYEIKTKRGFAYNMVCESFSSYSYGVFGYYFASDKKNIEDVLNIIFNIGAVFSKIASPENVLMAKNQILSEMEFAYEKTSFRAEYYSNLALQGLYKQTFSYELNNFEKVSFVDLYGVFKKIIGQKPKITILSDTQIDKRVRKIYEHCKQVSELYD
jgi:predicted Zn-dependent peptidase